MRPVMEQIWMELSKVLALRSTCDRLKVGCVITNNTFERVYSVGYNGGAKGQNNKCESTEPGKCGHIHAEINALIKCQVNDNKKVMFVSILPCSVCAKAIINSGFSEVYYTIKYRDISSIKILKDAGITIYQEI